MNFQNCVLAVFSPTGGTEKIAQAVAQGMDLPVRVVDLCRETAVQTVAANELLVAALPVFGGHPAGASQHDHGGLYRVYAVCGALPAQSEKHPRTHPAEGQRLSENESLRAQTAGSVPVTHRPVSFRPADGTRWERPRKPF